MMGETCAPPTPMFVATRCEKDSRREPDREVTEYYDLRSGSRLESFSHLVATNIGVGGAHVSPIMEVLHEQGLCLR